MRRLVQVAWVLVGLLWADQAVAQAQGAACPPSATPPTVSLKHKPDEVVYRTDLTSAELDALNRKIKRIDKVTGNTKTNGLTVERFDLKYRIEARVKPVGPNQFCAVFIKMDADLGITEHTVYIAKPYPPESCEYQAIRDHEDTHVAINRRVIKGEAPAVLARLDAEVRALGPIKVDSPQAATAHFNGRIKPVVTALVETIKRKLRAENAAFDSPAEYKRVAKLCRNW